MLLCTNFPIIGHACSRGALCGRDHTLQFVQGNKYGTYFRGRNNFGCLRLLCQTRWWDRKHKGFSTTATFFRFFAGHKHAEVYLCTFFLYHQGTCLPKSLGELKTYLEKRTAQLAQTSRHLRAEQTWAAASAQPSEIACELGAHLTVREKPQQTWKGSW